MSFSKSGSVITQTGASSSNRDTPQDLINAGLAGVSSSGSFQINIDADLIIDGYYDDSGWTYTFGSGYIIRKGANANWTSGVTSNNQVTKGFLVNYGGNAIKTINSGAGGVINWKDVVFRAYSATRADLSLSPISAPNIDSSTTWNIDRITVDLTANTSSHFRIEVDTGSIVNVRSINSAILVLSPIVENLVATSPDNTPIGTGLVQKVEVFKDNVTIIEYQPNLQIDGQALGSNHFWADADADGFRTTIYQDMVTPSFFDWTTDYLIYGSGRVIATRRFQLIIKDSSGSPFSGAILKLTNDNDSDSVELSSSSAASTIDQQVNVFVGRKTTFTSSYISPPDQDDLQEKTLTVGLYGKLTSSVPAIDFSSGPVSSSIFLLDNGSITETNKATVDAYTTLENSQKFYDRFESFRNTLANINVVTGISRSGSTIDAGSYNVTIDATSGSAFSIAGSTITIKASAFAGTINTTGTLTLANGSIINGSFSSISIDFATSGTYNLQNSTFSGTLTVSNSSGGAVTVKVLPGTTVVNNGPNITVDDTETGLVTAPNIIDGSRYQLYNVTQTNEIANGLVSGGSGLSLSVILGAGQDALSGDTIRLRVTYQSGTSAKNELESTALITSAGVTFLDSQTDNEVYNSYGIDGSTITQFSADYADDEVDITVASNFNGKDFYSWWVYNETTAQGIAEFFGVLTALDQANLRINSSLLNVFIDNATSTNIWQNDNVRIFREDGNYPVKNPATSGGGGVDIVWRNQIFIAETGVSGLTATESSTLLAIPTNPLLTNDSRLDTFDTKTNVKPSVSI